MGNSLEGVVCGNIGVGAVGAYMSRLQRREGAEVLVYDINGERAREVAEEYGCEVVSFDDLLARSDWTSVSVLPLREVFSVMWQIGERKHLLKPGSLLLDHSGVKTGKENTLNVLLKQGPTFETAMLDAVADTDAEAISIHLAFRPDVEPEGQNVYISPVKPTEGGIWSPRITDMLRSYDANVYSMTPEQQDMVTLRHQMIPWIALFASFDAIRQSGSDMPFEEIERLTTKLSQPFFDLMKRMVGGNPQVYWDTMLHHPSSKQAASLLEQSIHQLLGRLVDGEEAGAGFAAAYNHLQAIAESGSPERKTGKPIMAEVYYDGSHYGQMQEALRVSPLHSRSFHGPISVSMIDAGRINELRRAQIPVANYTTYGHIDKSRQPEIAFFVRNTPHPEHPEKRGMRFSPIQRKDPERAQPSDQHYTRIQLEPLHQDPIVNFFMNIGQDPVLSPLQPFVVQKAL